MVKGTLTYLEVSFLPPGWIDGKPSPSEQTSIDRPCPRAEHRSANGQDRQENVNPHLLMLRGVERQRGPDLVEGNHRSHHRGPQAAKQKDAGSGGDQVSGEDDRSRRANEAGDTEVD